MKPTICINLINFNLIKDSKKVHSCFILKEQKSHSILTDHLLLHFLELDKFVQDKNFNNVFEKWIGFFRYEGQREEIMADIIQNDPLLSKAHEKYTQFTSNEELMELYHSRMKQQADIKTGLEEAEEKGMQKGMLEGKLETAKKMLCDGISIEKIMEYTGLPLETIRGVSSNQN